MTRKFLLGGAFLAALSIAAPAQATTYAVGHSIYTDALTGSGGLANFVTSAFTSGWYDYLLSPAATTAPTLDTVSADPANPFAVFVFTYLYGQPGGFATTIKFAETATTLHTATYHLQQFGFGSSSVTTQLAVSADRTIATPAPLAGAGLLSAFAGLLFWRRRKAESLL